MANVQFVIAIFLCSDKFSLTIKTRRNKERKNKKQHLKQKNKP